MIMCLYVKMRVRENQNSYIFYEVYFNASEYSAANTVKPSKVFKKKTGNIGKHFGKKLNLGPKISGVFFKCLQKGQESLNDFILTLL